MSAQAARAHLDRARKLYVDFRNAQAAVEAHEIRILRECGGDNVVASELLSESHAPKDWVYRSLVGPRTGILAQLRVEIDMALTYAAVVTVERGSQRWED